MTRSTAGRQGGTSAVKHSVRDILMCRGFVERRSWNDRRDSDRFRTDLSRGALTRGASRRGYGGYQGCRGSCRQAAQACRRLRYRCGTRPTRGGDRCRRVRRRRLLQPGGANVVAAHVRGLGGVQILVHVAGGSSSPGGGFASLTDDHWMDELQLNLLGAVRLDRALAPAMIE